jgi:hypothetical protein
MPLRTLEAPEGRQDDDGRAPERLSVASLTGRPTGELATERIESALGRAPHVAARGRGLGEEHAAALAVDHHPHRRPPRDPPSQLHVVRPHRQPARAARISHPYILADTSKIG